MLTHDSVHVWRVRLDVSSGISAAQTEIRMGELRDMLSLEEQRKANAFRAAEHRREYILAHAALRRVLGQLLEIPPLSVVITASDGTKPILSPIGNLAQSHLDLRFNLSHTRGAALIGVTQGRELGVDIEWQRPMNDLQAIARSMMSQEELGRWKTLEEEDRFRAFYRVWTRKEAYLKAIGLGLSRDLKDVTVPVSTDFLDEGAEGYSRVQDREGTGIWPLRDVEVLKDYSASVCWQGLNVKRLIILDLDIWEQPGA